MTTNTALTPSISSTPSTDPAVALITALSQAADLSADEYRRIYDRVAAGRSLRNIELALRSAVSYAWWGQYAAGAKSLDRDRKNELRIWAGIPPLPPTPAAAVAAGAHPDAAVYQIGSAIASRIVLIGADVPAVNLRINGACTVISPELSALPYTHHVTGVTGYSRRPQRKSVHLCPNTWKRLNSRRLELGLTWDDFLARLAGTS